MKRTLDKGIGTIAYLIPSLVHGGAEYQTIAHVNFLWEKGYSIHLIVLSNRQDLLANLKLPKERIHILAHNSYNTLHSKSILSSFSLAKELASLLNNLEVKYLITVLGYSQWVARLAMKMTPFKSEIIAYYRGMDYTENPLKGLPHRIFNKYNKRLAKNFDHKAIFISKAVKSDVAKHFYIPEVQTVMPNSIVQKTPDQSLAKDFLIEKRIDESKAFLIIFPGRVQDKVKGHQFFLTALEQFISKNNIAEGSLKVLILGDGPDRANLESFSLEKNLSGFVLFNGYTSNDLLLSLMSICNLVVVPSFIEGLGNVAIEAFMTKSILLCSDAGGLPELVQDGKTGYVFPKGNSDEFLEKLELIYFNRSRPLIAKDRIYQHYLDHFTIEVQMKNILNFLVA